MVLLVVREVALVAAILGMELAVLELSVKEITAEVQ
tara:strand:+ start:304 stop:411 length:108 start_codon:yes stop_codon:yes gene_type:complete